MHIIYYIFIGTEDISARCAAFGKYPYVHAMHALIVVSWMKRDVLLQYLPSKMLTKAAAAAAASKPPRVR